MCIWKLLGKHGLKDKNDVKAAADILNVSYDVLHEFTFGRGVKRKSLLELAWINDLCIMIGCDVTAVVESYRQTRWGGSVYIMHDNGLYKIGRSQNPHDRLIALRVKYPTIKQIHDICSNDSLLLERAVHRQFAERQVIYHGEREWFDLDPTELEVLLSIRKVWYRPLLVKG